MKPILKVVANCRVGDIVVPAVSNFSTHPGWEVLEIKGDFVRYACRGLTLIGSSSDMVQLRPRQEKCRKQDEVSVLEFVK